MMQCQICHTTDTNGAQRTPLTYNVVHLGYDVGSVVLTERIGLHAALFFPSNLTQITLEGMVV